MIKWIVGLILITLISCGNTQNTDEQLTDPILMWDPVTTNCIGESITGVKYNVYAINGSGPIPIILSMDEEPCGIVQLAAIAPLNSTPIVETTYNAIVSNGVWTFAVDAEVGGIHGGISNQITVTVTGRPSVIINLTTGKIIDSEQFLLKPEE